MGGLRVRPAGFTLLELMIVVFIVGLVTAGTIIAFGGQRNDTELERETQRLDALFDYAREQAELQTRDYGFRINNLAYSFVVFDVLQNQWRPVDEDEAMRERKFPEGIDPVVVVDGRRIVLDKKKPGIPDFAPQVMIFANGDLSSFEIFLKREGGGDESRIYTDEQTNIQMSLPGDVPQRQ